MRIFGRFRREPGDGSPVADAKPAPPSVADKGVRPVDEIEWARWSARAAGHDMSPRLISPSGEIRRDCACGWVGPLGTAQGAREAHQAHRGFGG